jgi:hypothetical protein
MTPVAGSLRNQDTIPETERKYLSFSNFHTGLLPHIAAYSEGNREPDFKPDHSHFSTGVRKKVELGLYSPTQLHGIDTDNFTF